MFTHHPNRPPTTLAVQPGNDPIGHHHHRMHDDGVDVVVADGHEALVVFEGRIVASLGPGHHNLHPEEIAYWTDGEDGWFDTWFVSTATLGAITVTDRLDPDATPFTATARFRITEPPLLVESLAPQVDLARPEAFTYWLGRQLVGAVRAAGPNDPAAVAAALADLVGPNGVVVVPPIEVAAGSGTGAEPSACGSCGAATQPGDRFCSGCGASLDSAGCAACGSALRPGSRFCSSCGAAAPGSGIEPPNPAP